MDGVISLKKQLKSQQDKEQQQQKDCGDELVLLCIISEDYFHCSNRESVNMDIFF